MYFYVEQRVTEQFTRSLVRLMIDGTGTDDAIPIGVGRTTGESLANQ